jgi:hypothetical protein
MQVNTTVTVLELPGNDFGPRGMHHLSGMLEDNHTITHLVSGRKLSKQFMNPRNESRSHCTKGVFFCFIVALHCYL